MLKILFCYLNINTVILILVLIIFSIILYLQNKYSHWSSKGVSGPKPIWIFGNGWSRTFSEKSVADFDSELYRKYGGSKFCGYYEMTKPILMVGDQQLLKHIMIKDFEHFTDRCFETFINDVMDQMLLGLKGSVWKKVRSVMTPTFSSAKVKQTLSLVKDCSENLVKYFHDRLNHGCSVFEMKDVFGMFTMDTIASIAFGVSSDSLNNTENEFSAAAERFFKPCSKWKRPFVVLQFMMPQISKFLGLNSFDNSPINFFTKVVSDTIKFRLENGVRRSDFLQLLLDASVQEHTNNNKEDNLNVPKEEKILTETVITAQCVLFYIAGYDTTATTLSFASYCLALHPEIQERLVQEVDAATGDLAQEDITFEVIHGMTYLDMVISETIRLFPPAPRVDRRCTKEFVLPGTDIVIEKDTKITIPIYSIHRDPRHYKDPDVFDPERFSPENKINRQPMIYMPFGAGPRNCIGVRFALMEAKVALVRLLKEFVFVPTKKTQVPIKFEKRTGLLKAEDGVWIKLAVRTKC